jgi:hypothetical protein
VCADAEEQRRHEPRAPPGACETDRDPCQRLCEPVAHDEPAHGACFGAERHADAHPTRPARHGERQHAEHADGRHHERERGTERQQQHRRTRRRHRLGLDLRERADARDRQGGIQLPDLFPYGPIVVIGSVAVRAANVKPVQNGISVGRP